MKVLFVITGLGIGGAERQVCDLADQLVQKGCVVKIISLTDLSQEKTLPQSGEVEIIVYNLKKDILSFFKTLKKLKAVIQKFQPDVVHSHMFHANITARLLRLTVKFPKLICTAHSTNEGGKLRMLIYRLTDFLADINTNVSRQAVESFIQKGVTKKRKIISVKNGISTDVFHKNEVFRTGQRSNLGFIQTDYLFFAVGRLVEAKDYPNLLYAFAEVRKQQKNAKLAIVGMGELYEQLLDLSRQSNIQDTVSFLGLRRDIPEIMNIADTYVLSSEYEGFALVIGEAMATERVVVATDCGGVRDLLGDCGFLVPPQNYEKLAEAMLQSMSLSFDEREEIGKRARRRIQEHFSLDAVADRWLNIYRHR